MNETTIALTAKECSEIHDLIGMLSGGNPENVWDPDGKDDPNDPQVTALVKIYALAGASVPKHLQR